ncbi:MAG: hypothetical protein OXM59_08410 [Gammaproteobacteria bacterium]|nr:hypothetical protein [Gammaproteobacteria bacterium]
MNYLLVWTEICGATLAPLRSAEWISHEGKESVKSAAYREYFFSSGRMTKRGQNENRRRAC